MIRTQEYIPRRCGSNRALGCGKLVLFGSEGIKFCPKCGLRANWSNQIGRVKLRETISVLRQTKWQLLLTHDWGLLAKIMNRLVPSA